MKIVKNQGEIAQKMGISTQTITEILGGRMKLTTEKVVNFCSIYGFSCEWILTGEGEMFVQPPTANTINSSGDFCENIIGGDLKQQLAELITIQKKFQDMISVKDKQINELIEILKDKKK
ncbi:MAG: helix-turn-helix transcriptional regulator [Bacteroidales bacterium]|nr:helix-turn-helix transcriptional regulator [Bacteroidales bacterium]